MTGLSSIWRNTALSSIATAIQGIANLITVVYMARILDPVNYGIFSYTWAIIGMIGAVTYLGIPPLLTRQLSRTDNFSPIIGYGISLTGLVSLIVTTGFIVGVYIIPSLNQYQMLFDLWGITVWINGVNPRWIFSGLQRLWIPSLGDLLGAVMRLVLTVLFVHSPTNLSQAVEVTVISIMIPAIGEIIWLRWLVPFRLTCISLRQGWKTIREGLPLGVTSLVSILYSGLDTWILHAVMGARAVGYYSAAYRPIIFLLTFSGVYFNITFPLLSRLMIREPNTARKVLQLANISIFALVVPLGVGTDVIANPLILYAFGHQYTASGAVLAVLIWSYCLGLLRDIFSITLVASNHEILFAKLFAIGAVVNVGLMVWLVRWGPIGTATALVITQGLLLVSNVWAVQRILPNSIDIKSQAKPFIKIIINSVVMGICVWEIRTLVPVEVAIGVGILLYGTLTILTRSMPWHEVLDAMRMRS